MLKKLKSRYSITIISPDSPNYLLNSDYHWFRDPITSEWVGIPTKELSETELLLLQNLFDHHTTYTSTTNNTLHAEKWFQFLFLNGNPPNNEEIEIRISQFSYYGEAVNPNELETGFSGFFSKNTAIVWVSPNNGLIIEELPQLPESEFLSISQTLESEFFIKLYFYIGKNRPLTDQLPHFFQEERQLFEKGKKLLPVERVFNFEKTFPYLLTNHMSQELIQVLNREILPVFSEDPELLRTVKAYLDSNFNVTLTAKTLYVHRNTLQYRLDKFSEKTGINIKSFTGALTVYLACILNE